jgi:peptidoglycan/xylan/chitin deacetylase (PgdA/CDA1 family)
MPNPTRTLILTHDVDWPLNGPGKAHVLARKERFPPEVISKVANENFNPYYGIPTIMEIEEKFGIRSTFFFRPKYDDGNEVSQYRETIRALICGGWEVGLHCNNTASLEQVAKEKASVEKAAGQVVFGSRVHYLKVMENSFENLAKAGIKYDSSLSFNKEKIDLKNTGFLEKSGLIVFPITFMDAYLFTYMGLTEESIVPFMVKTIEELFAQGAHMLTLLWHDNAVMMRGGRAYAELIKQLANAPKEIKFLKGIEAYEIGKQKGEAK